MSKSKEITFDAVHDDPVALSEREQDDRFEAIADTIGDVALAELVIA